jgi:hypothetical protein
VGNVFVFADVVAVVAGVSATGRVGQVLVWGPIRPDPGNGWTNIEPSDTTGWTDVVPGTGNIWSPVAA